MDVLYLWLCVHVALQFALLCEHAFKLATHPRVVSIYRCLLQPKYMYEILSCHIIFLLPGHIELCTCCCSGGCSKPQVVHIWHFEVSCHKLLGLNRITIYSLHVHTSHARRMTLITYALGKNQYGLGCVGRNGCYGSEIRQHTCFYRFDAWLTLLKRTRMQTNLN